MNKVIRVLVATLLFCGGGAVWAAVELRFNTQEFPPYNFSRQGVVQGPIAEVIRRICIEIEAECTLRSHYFWGKAQKEVKEGQAHALFVIGKNPQRERWLRFSLPLVRAEYGFFVHRDNPFQYHGLGDLAGYKVGVYGPSNTSYSLYKLRETMMAEEIEPISIDMWVDTPFNLQKLRVGSLEAVYSNRKVGEAWIDFYGIPDLRYAGTQRELNYYIGFAKDTVDAQLVEQFNQSYRRLHEDGTLTEIFARYDLKPLPLP